MVWIWKAKVNGNHDSRTECKYRCWKLGNWWWNPKLKNQRLTKRHCNHQEHPRRWCRSCPHPPARGAPFPILQAAVAYRQRPINASYIWRRTNFLQNEQELEPSRPNNRTLQKKTSMPWLRNTRLERKYLRLNCFQKAKSTKPKYKQPGHCQVAALLFHHLISRTLPTAPAGSAKLSIRESVRRPDRPGQQIHARKKYRHVGNAMGCEYPRCYTAMSTWSGTVAVTRVCKYEGWQNWGAQPKGKKFDYSKQLLSLRKCHHKPFENRPLLLNAFRRRPTYRHGKDLAAMKNHMILWACSKARTTISDI